MMSISDRLTALETQVKRIISDIESEKGTRERQDMRIESLLQTLQTGIEKKMEEGSKARDEKLGKMEIRLGKIEKIILVATGAAVAANQIFPLLKDAVKAAVGQ